MWRVAPGGVRAAVWVGWLRERESSPREKKNQSMGGLGGEMRRGNDVVEGVSCAGRGGWLQVSGGTLLSSNTGRYYLIVR